MSQTLTDRTEAEESARRVEAFFERADKAIEAHRNAVRLARSAPVTFAAIVFEVT